MSITEIAEKVVGYCRSGDYQTCYQELFSPDVVSLEPKGAMVERTEGMEALMQKGKAWQDMVEEMHSASVGDPIVAGNHFACTMMIDCTFKGVGRQKMEEVCVYEVKDGKVVKEQFFYEMPDQG